MRFERFDDRLAFNYNVLCICHPHTGTCMHVHARACKCARAEQLALLPWEVHVHFTGGAQTVRGLLVCTNSARDCWLFVCSMVSATRTLA